MKYRILITIMAVGLFNVGQAQILSTLETKVVFVVSEQTDQVSNIALLSTIQKMDSEQLAKYFDNHKFYLGLLKGNYERHGTEIIPKGNTTVILFTEKQLFLKPNVFSADSLQPGDLFEVGKTKTKVVSNKKGELVLKT